MKARKPAALPSCHRTGDLSTDFPSHTWTVRLPNRLSMSLHKSNITHSSPRWHRQEERAALEEKVTQQLEAERRALLARKRAQQDERRRKAEDLERILLENQRKVPFLLFLSLCFSFPSQAQQEARRGKAEDLGCIPLESQAKVPVCLWDVSSSLLLLILDRKSRTSKESSAEKAEVRVQARTMFVRVTRGASKYHIGSYNVGLLLPCR